VKKTMKLFMVLFVGVFLCLAGSIVQAQAAPYYNIIDEYGPGYSKDMDPSSNGTWNIWNGALRPDPTVAGATSLIYIGYRGNSNFPGYLDYPVYDPNGTISDDLRFWLPTNPGSIYIWVIFYSVGGGGAPADTGIPTDLNIQATLNENPDGTFYWKSLSSGNEILGYSEGRAPNPVPEPATMLLLGSGLIGLVGYGRKKFFKK
jgi:hypothetical protein